MNLKALTLSAMLALAPALAGAVTYNGSFNPGGVLDTEHDIDGGGFQGDAIIRASADDAGLPFSQAWTFTATEALKVAGEGTVRRADFFQGLSVTFNGSAVALQAGAATTSTFMFPVLPLLETESVDVVISWTDFLGSDCCSSAITFDIDTTADVAPVPLPMAGWMLLGALGSLAVLRRRTLA